MDKGVMELDVLERIFDGSIKPRDVTLSALKSITENFSNERIIGEGGFGTVYEGVLQNGKVAVKRIRNNQTIDEKLFRREVNSLLNISHKNIVRFLGFCSNTEHKAIEYEGSKEYIYAEDRERILCFEYINNGSLDKYIADELRGLQWETRYLIIKGICEGLEYLHMKRHIIHMDLKPANILIDNNMVAKITDFGLSRMEENSQTKSTNRFLSLGYSAPEYLANGKMSVKSDVYSLGIIIVELVTGHRSIPDINNVLRRWRHRWRKLGKETPFGYNQITKLIEIALLCQEKDPYKRPFISYITREINELDKQISNENESTVEQISAYPEDDMLAIEPLELCFPFELNKQVSCSVELTNETNAYIAFSIQTTSPLPYSIQPSKDTVAPGSKYSVNITLQPLDNEPQDRQCNGDFIVRSTKVKESLKSEDITEDTFRRQDGKFVDEVNLTITCKAKVPEVDVSLGSLVISDNRSLDGPHESNMLPTEAESKVSTSTSDDVIQFDPPEISFPMVPDKMVLSSVKIINNTESYVSIDLRSSTGSPTEYKSIDFVSILPPESTQWLILKREVKGDAVQDVQLNEFIHVWYALVAEGIEASDLVREDYSDCMKLPVVLTKVNSCTSNELIQFNPPELSFPCLNKTSLSAFSIVNITDCYTGFHLWNYSEDGVSYNIEPRQGILPPQSAQRVVVKRAVNKKETEEMQYKSNLFVWNMIVAEGVEASNVSGCSTTSESKELPLIFEKASPSIPNELIQFDQPELSIPFVPNKPFVFSTNIVNNTDYHVGFDKLQWQRNVGWYYINPAGGVLPPRSTQRLVVKRVPDNKEQDEMQCQDKFLLWSSLVSEGIEANDLADHINYEECKELPVVYEETNLSTSDELIQFDPPQLSFPFLQNKKVSMLHKFKIVNATDHTVGFSIWSRKSNSGSYRNEPEEGILPPKSAQAIKVRRTIKENKMEDMQSNDTISVWNGIVTQGVQASDLRTFDSKQNKELSIVLTKPGRSSSG